MKPATDPPLFAPRAPERPPFAGCMPAVEHCGFARYGSLREWAKDLGHEEARKLLSEILDQEKATNIKLTNLAVTSVNKTGATAKAA